MDKRGLVVNSIYKAVISIDFGRKGFATRGVEQEGRISFETGISEAVSAFKEAQATANPETIILAEYTFISQELQICDENDTDSLSSLTKAIQSFDDAFLALQIVENRDSYKDADKTYPHDKKYRVRDYPKDSFHIACISHDTRLKNSLRYPGIDPIEKELLKQRRINLSAAQAGYINKQKKAMES